ncbi:hypothetical protein [Aliiroseovarius subalbicans]|uniref:hypothetical protein n=1 Tax=Aliiroseovarius subalbicans TaxID=2925840 RepID=UPI001F592BF9|nr:hypothetical protein [Aliiroseovarius subalbicans]MCI2398333.1 hypothetical protein [Aliiroseovarius subalbicans]
MRWWHWLLIAAATLAIAYLLLVFFLLRDLGKLFSYGPEDVSGLPQVALADKVNLSNPALQRIALQDHDRGWFLIDDPARAQDSVIGFHGPRIAEIFLLGLHVPVYCNDGDGKILWPVAGDQIIQAMAFCNPSRMDLSALVALARPVAMHSQTLPRTGIEDWRAGIEANPDARWITRPEPASDLTHRRRVDLPAQWMHKDNRVFGWHDEVIAATKAFLTAQGAPDGSFSIQMQDGFVGPFALPGESPTDPPRHVGTLFQDNGPAMILPEWLSVYAPYLEVDCLPDTCALLETLDLGDVPRGMRDMALFERARSHAVPLPRGQTEQDIRSLPGAATPRPHDTSQITLTARYVVPR